MLLCGDGTSQMGIQKERKKHSKDVLGDEVEEELFYKRVRLF
jgi:hypothetical protein